ncbi:polysialic acid transporter [Capnocytophaga canimorsus]|uniref:SLBB domain-containing protein n=1 Tax=Capnocytophaga canimorsus TaxID=28188 RepID=UPI000D6E06FA|nr:SLBB domain-containing protein [Capnocytophaga canimorsus]AWL78139.1 polysialic acid transporter [Capnocytophaga canimorsus]
MPKIKFLFLFILCLAGSFRLTAQEQLPTQVDLQQISNINVDNLSDEQIKVYWDKAQQQGYSLEQLEAMARAKGMPQVQIAKLKQRIQMLPLYSKPTQMKPDTELDNADFDLTFGYTGYEKKNKISKKDSIFGLDFFKNPNISFTPNTNMATPENYQVGPGDILLIEIWGATENKSTQKVDNEGNILIDGVGKVKVGGFSFADVKNKINSSLRRIYSGIGASENSYNKVYTGVSIAQVRTVKVNIIGEVAVPGTYSLSALSTVLNALYACGGPTESGTFRDIRLVRNGQKIATFDVYDFLVKGSEVGNLPLQDQDVIIVSPYLNRIQVGGEVKRKGIYEAKDGETLANLVTYFGGFTSDAFTNTLVVERISKAKREVREISFEAIADFQLQNGDRLTVHKITDEYQNKLSIGGAVYQPGTYEFKEGMTASDLLNRANGVRKEASLERGLIFRTKNRVDIQTVSFSVKDLLEKTNDVRLQENDSIHIFHKDSLRFERFVKVEGAVNKPKKIPFMENMTVKDAIALAGGFSEGADITVVHVFRQINDGNYINKGQSFQVSGAEQSQQDTLTLVPNDVISVRYIKGYSPLQTVSIEGEVAFPGVYGIHSKNERISDLVLRAGGLSPYAYVKGATLIRKKTDKNEKQQKELLEEMVAADDTESLKKIDTKATEFRIGINLEKILANKRSKYDLILNEGDVLLIPNQSQTVEVKGEVLAPSLVRFDPSMGLRDYIDGAGGFADRAKRRAVYVMYANGEIKSTHNSLFFRNYPQLEPGAIIIVPKKRERKPLTTAESLSILTGLSTIGYILVNLIKQ